MATSAIAESQRKAAKVAGLAYLITFAAVVYVNFGIHDRLITDNAAQTARNVLAHERLFPIGITGDLIYCADVVVLLTAVYAYVRFEVLEMPPSVVNTFSSSDLVLPTLMFCIDRRALSIHFVCSKSTWDSGTVF